jgi:peptidoglycan hydrolase CwlO-like protein
MSDHDKNILSHVVTFFLTFVVIILLLLNYYTTKQTKNISDKRQSEFVQQRDALQSELEVTRKQRDSLFSRIDSLDIDNKNLSSVIELKDKQIAKIKGRYNKVSQDSLGILMDQRAAK